MKDIQFENRNVVVHAIFYIGKDKLTVKKTE